MPTPRTPKTHEDALTARNWTTPPAHLSDAIDRDVVLDCGWGRLLFGQTFDDHGRLAAELAREEAGTRDICLYLRDPHVLVSMAPDQLFIDPSHTYRLWLHKYQTARDVHSGVNVRSVTSEADVRAINRIYAACGMVTAPTAVLWDNQLQARLFRYLVAEDTATGEIIGAVTGVDHVEAFRDPERGTSLWCLAVDPQASVPGVGEALVRALVEKYLARGRAYLDLSVMHDNTAAIRLYEKLGFERIPAFCVKRKNSINETLFSVPPPDGYEALNPYARIIADEARRRGIGVEVQDAEAGFMKLAHGGREVVTRESLPELTSAVVMSRCDDKLVTRRIFAAAGLAIPEGRPATFDQHDAEFLRDVGELVVKPRRGEQGAGISVGVREPTELKRALEHARRFCPDVLLERRHHGLDLRVVVIDHAVVAAAVRRPANVVGTGRHTIMQLIDAQSRRRATATGGESHIPVDDATRRVVADAGYDLDDILPEGTELEVRRTANLHTGGTIHDVTAELSPTLAQAAVAASRALEIPVTGIDMIVPDVAGEEYVLIEANERPGLANHEPQPTAERFVDLLFPSVPSPPKGWQPDQPAVTTDHAAEV